MEIFRKKEEIRVKRPSALALGFFDGLHLGHTELIKECVSFAGSRGLSADVFTFHDHPKNILSGKLVIPRLLTEDKKLEYLQALGVDRVYDFDFADGFHTISPRAFAEDYIKDLFSAEDVFCGFNFHFGAEAEGDPAALSRLGNEMGFATHIIDSVYVSGDLVSSTLIRHCINEGRIEQANLLLGRDYCLEGFVEKGNKLGRGFGFPTANIRPDPEMTLPAFGVYVTETFENGIYYPSVSNVGVKPTVSDEDAVRIETHLLDAHLLDTELSLYDKNISVAFKKMLREERRFENKEALVNQIGIDAEKARACFNKI